nr:transposase [Ardenticatena sp.]
MGRPAISPVVLALVTVFQYLEDLPDREAAQCVRVRIDWKYALHLPLEDSGFHYSTLCSFRRRLEAHGQERLFFEKVLELLQAQGVVKKRGRQRTDSTHVLGVVKELSRLELIWESLRVVLRAIAQVAPEWYAEHLPAALRTEYT